MISKSIVTCFFLIVSTLALSADSDLQEPPLCGKLSVQVVDDTGNPTGPCTVEWNNGQYIKTMKTDSLGKLFQDRMPVGRYMIKAYEIERARQASGFFSIYLSRTTRAVLVLHPKTSGDEGAYSLKSDSHFIQASRSDVDGNGNITQQEQVIGDKLFRVKYWYDEKDRLIKMEDNFGLSRLFTYTQFGKILKIADSVGDNYVFFYSQNGQLQRISLPLGYKIRYLRENDRLTKRISSFNGDILYEFSYTLNQDGAKILVEEGAQQKDVFLYNYENNECSDIRDLHSGQSRSQIVAQFKTALGKAGSTLLSTESQDEELFKYKFDQLGNITSIRIFGTSLELKRDFNSDQLLIAEHFLCSGQPLLETRLLL